MDRSWYREGGIMPDDWKNGAVADELANAARVPFPYMFENLPVPWWRRLWHRIDPWLPRVHLGPCDHEGCE